jgi:hypothetical protein
MGALEGQALILKQSKYGVHRQAIIQPSLVQRICCRASITWPNLNLLLVLLLPQCWYKFKVLGHPCFAPNSCFPALSSFSSEQDHEHIPWYRGQPGLLLLHCGYRLCSPASNL